MYKKFLVPMLLTAALAGCGHQSSDKQTDQTDTALPVQDQITTPTPSHEMDQGQQPAVNPSSVEPTQPPPAATDNNTAVQQPSALGTSSTTPAPAAGTSSTTPSTPPSTTDNKKDAPTTNSGSGVDTSK